MSDYRSGHPQGLLIFSTNVWIQWTACSFWFAPGSIRLLAMCLPSAGLLQCQLQVSFSLVPKLSYFAQLRSSKWPYGPGLNAGQLFFFLDAFHVEVSEYADTYKRMLLRLCLVTVWAFSFLKPTIDILSATNVRKGVCYKLLPLNDHHKC